MFSPGTPVSSTNRTDCHDIAEILLKVALNTITLTIFLLELAIATKAETIETMINRNDTNGCLEKNPQKGHKHKKPEKTMIYMGTFIITSWCKTDIYIYIARLNRITTHKIVKNSPKTQIHVYRTLEKSTFVCPGVRLEQIRDEDKST